VDKVVFVLVVLHFKAPLSRFISQHGPHHTVNGAAPVYSVTS